MNNQNYNSNNYPDNGRGYNQSPNQNYGQSSNQNSGQNYGQNAGQDYGQSSNQSYGQNYGQNGMNYSQPPAGNAAPGYPGSNQVPYTNPQPGMMPVTPQKSKAPVAAIVAVVLVVLACIGYFAEKSFQKEDSQSANTSNSDNVAVTDVDGGTSVPVPVPEEEDVPYSKGVLTANSYESEFVGIRYSAPSGWVNRSEAENKQTATAANTECELFSVRTSDGCNMILMIETLPSENVTMDTYLKSIKSVIQNTSGIPAESIKDSGTYTIAGKDYETISFENSNDNAKFTQKYYLRKSGNRMIAFLVTMTSPDVESEFFANVKAY